MSKNDPHPSRCHGALRKVRFPSRAYARQIMRNRHRGDHTMSVYGPCDDCGGWHLGRATLRDAVLVALRKNRGTVDRATLREIAARYPRKSSSLRKILATMEKDGQIRRTETTVELVTGGGEDE